MDAEQVGTAGPRREDRRQALVGAAYAQIARQGFEGLRTRDVAAEVGVNIATLHYYFPSKESLIRGVVELSMQRFRSTLADTKGFHGVTGLPSCVPLGFGTGVTGFLGPAATGGSFDVNPVLNAE